MTATNTPLARASTLASADGKRLEDAVHKLARAAGMEVAVLLPCYNEAASIAQVVADFRRSLPGARIYVYDNNSTDGTSEVASKAGASVVRSPRQGKGNVVRHMFADIDADLYVMADGDGTYDASMAPAMVANLLENRLDMVVGTRRDVTKDAGRAGHAFGNRIFNATYQALFGSDFTDIFSGYRVFTRRFAKSFPAQSPGFEIETEMSVHASLLRLPVAEVECDYGVRGEGSESKLNSIRDGLRILRMMATLMKETRPFIFFAYVAVVLFGASVFLGAPVVVEYLGTGLVDRVPTWILSMTLLLGAMMALTAGAILDSLARSRVETKHIHYLSIAPARGEAMQSHVATNRREVAGTPAWRDRGRASSVRVGR